MSNTDAVTDDAPAPETETVTQPEPAPKEEASKPDSKVFDEAYVKQLRSEAAKFRSEAKAAAEELEQLRRAAMTEQERAIVEAREEGRRMAATEWGSKMVDAEIKAVAAGRFSEGQMNVLFQGLNRAAFLKEDGSVDMKSVQEFVEGLAPRPPESKPQSFPDLGQGIRTTDNTALNGDPLLRDLKRHLGIA